MDHIFKKKFFDIVLFTILHRSLENKIDVVWYNLTRFKKIFHSISLEFIIQVETLTRNFDEFSRIISYNKLQCVQRNALAGLKSLRIMWVFESQ